VARGPSSTPTLADVAERAGVSLATASRVINGNPHPVTDQLKARVREAARELNFLPNAHAQALSRPAKFRTVGVILHDVKDPYFAEICGGILKEAGDARELVMLCNSYRDPAKELEYVELLRGQRVAAIIMAGGGLDDLDYSRRLAEQITPFLTAGGRVAFIGRHHVPGDAVLPDNVGGAARLAGAVLDLGHETIGVIAGPPLLTTTRDRISGLAGAMRERGLELDESRLVYSDFTRDGGKAAAARLLDASPDITALVALNDPMAIGALALLAERGIAVPDQISVAGFDDIPISRDVSPALTTVRVPMAELGARALALTLGEEHTGLRVEHMACELVVRASTAPPPAKA
jgi:LacI family transcriptional regulator